MLFTEEQERIITSTEHNYTFVQAFAGTGKTSTLLEFARRNNESKILYLTFNTALANCENIKEMNNIESHTIHGFAFQKLGYEDVEINKFSLKFLRNLYNVDTRFANTIKRAYNFFLASTSIKPKMKHVLETDNTGLKNPENVLEYMKDLYDGMENGKYLMSHDFYLKKYILSKPILDYDIILIDEAQDLSPCVLKLLAQQDCKRVFVGDIFQQIYQFRNVVNPFDYIYQFDDTILLNLTKTFRYGPDLCRLSNDFLQTFTQNDINIECDENCDTSIYSSKCNLPSYTFISRTNKGILEKAVELCNDGKKFDLFDKMYNFKKEKEIFDLLHQSKKTIHEDLIPIIEKKFGRVKNLKQLKELVIDLQNFKWLNRILITEKYKENIWGKIENNFVKGADIILMNAHQSKGLEFDTVVLGNDFRQLIHKSGSFAKYHQEDEYNLMYVAMTRAKKRLYINDNLKAFLRKKYDKSIVYKECMVNRCHKCGEKTNLQISHGRENLPVYVKPRLEMTYHFCLECTDIYINSIPIINVKFYRN